MAQDMYDTVLLGVLQKEGQIAKFLDVVMGFLYRRTDFYHIMQSKEDKIGFPPGVAPKLLIQAYEKYEELSKRRNPAKDTRTIIPSRPDQSGLGSVAEQYKGRKPAETKPSTKETKGTTAHPPDGNITSQTAFQQNPESHNGAQRENYRWAQTLTDCDLRVKVPTHIEKAKHVKVKLNRKRVGVSYLEGGETIDVVDEELVWPINCEESMWSLIPGDCVHLSLEKVQERWWEHVFPSEPKINTQEIEASVPIDSLDTQARSAVDQLVYDEQQKQQGLPTSKQQQMEGTLKKAWDAEGSPFAGTPFDPTTVTMTT